MCWERHPASKFTTSKNLVKLNRTIALVSGRSQVYIVVLEENAAT